MKYQEQNVVNMQGSWSWPDISDIERRQLRLKIEKLV